ncbi:MAG: hypothetical protein J6X14_02240 [Lachnospiraceae bacterium]|nr:hypothetical protein [Lachnospiraceae bacterium]MBP5669108.1 hypothetical protein [Lachnospiraceae bacterium]MBP5733750.1 hypothetical protein [Lachnospiraceae bacterium]
MGNSRIYEDGKYAIQDVGTLYVGCKFTFEELLECEEVPFKFRLVCERYLLPEADLEDTLETHLYYLDPKSFEVKILKQLKAKIKVNLLAVKENLFGYASNEYITKNLGVDELCSLKPEEKEELGMVIQEIAVSKFALMAF